MTRWARLFIFTLLLGASSFTAQAAAEEPMVVQLVQEEETIQPGRSFWVALHMSFDNDSHAYWKNPGDAGFAPSVDWTLPEGFEVGNVVWPSPQKLTHEGAVSFGYTGELTLLAEVTPLKQVSADTITLQADVQWLICSGNTCLPGNSTATVSLPISTTTPKVASHATALFAKARALHPQTSNPMVQHNDGLIQISLRSDKAPTGANFFPEESDVIDHHVDAVVTQDPEDSSLYHVALKGQGSPSEKLKGILVLFDEGTQDEPIAMLDIDSPIVTGIPHTHISMVDSDEMTTYQPDDAITSFWVGLALAFVGGIILNLMPCVLPVISFKVMSFVKMAGESRAKILRHGIAFTLGVLISFWALAGAMLMLQAYGSAVGWGFQLQEPIFVAILATVIFIFALSLFGVFELGAGFASWAGQQSQTKSEGAIASFFSGILATAVATPCTGPFLGSAIGFAVSLPPILAMLIFTSLGLGMASPYLLLSAFPSLLRFMPKPGNWMVTFKMIMGFIMLATVLWLLWVFETQTSGFAVVLMLASFFFLSIGCWIYGQWGSPVKPKRTRIVSYVFTLAMFGFAGYIMHASSAHWVSAYDEWDHVHGDTGEHLAAGEVWERFSAERLAELRVEGTPVFIDFTAKWCLTCQANHLILSEGKVQNKFTELGIVKMKADWTKRDPEITKALSQFGRNSVPLYVLYGANGSKAEILPQILTGNGMLSYLKQLKEQQIAARNGG